MTQYGDRGPLDRVTGDVGPALLAVRTKDSSLGIPIVVDARV